MRGFLCAVLSFVLLAICIVPSEAEANGGRSVSRNRNVQRGRASAGFPRQTFLAPRAVHRAPAVRFRAAPTLRFRAAPPVVEYVPMYSLPVETFQVAPGYEECEVEQRFSRGFSFRH